MKSKLVTFEQAQTGLDGNERVLKGNTYITFALISDVQSEVGYFEKARLRMWNGRNLTDALHGGAQDVLALMNRCFYRTQIVEEVSLFLGLLVLGIEISVFHVHHVR